MASRAQRIVDKARGTVPEGTFVVGAGLAIAALCAYGFVIVSFRALDDDGNAGMSALWALIFVAGPGFFLPLEQEVGRAVAHRRAQGIGAGPLVRRAALFGGLLCAALVALTLAAYVPLRDELFHGDGVLVAALAFGLVGYYLQHLARGTLSGNGRFRPYGEMLASEAMLRLALAVTLAVVGVATAGPYGLALGLAPFVAVGLSMRGQHGLVQPGPPAPWSELSNALFYLLAGSVLAQALAYAPLLGANLLAATSDKTAVASFARAFFIARIPILLFQAVQAALLPRLASLAGSGRHDEFRAGLRRLLLVVVGIAFLGFVAAGTLGPTVGKILFGEDKFTTGNADLALLAAGSGAYVIALTMAQALIALEDHPRVALGFAVGVAAFFVVAVPVSDLFLRVELGFLAGSAAAAVVMGLLLLGRMRLGVPDSVTPLVEAVASEPLEI